MEDRSDTWRCAFSLSLSVTWFSRLYFVLTLKPMNAELPFPLTILQNEWVVLDPLQADHFEALYRAASDPLIWEQHPNPLRYQRDHFTTYFNGALASGGAFCIRNAGTGEVIGSSRFYEYDAENATLKIGYTFFTRACWGKPFNRSAKTLMLNQAFTAVPTVVFEVGEQNLRSRRAMEKLGAELKGRHEVAYFGEPPRMNCIYEIGREAWKKTNL